MALVSSSNRKHMSIKAFLDQEIRAVNREARDNALVEHKKELSTENALFSIHITEHKGKLENIPSINTSSLTNPYCVARSKNEKTICSKCYSNSLSKIRKQLEAKLIQNSAVLSERLIPMARLPVFNNLYVRMSSFGDLINMKHFLNLIKIARKNPKTNFALWTKRTDIVKEFFKIHDDNAYIYFPKNLIMIYSNPLVDAPMYEVPTGFDKVFQVFSKKYIAENNQMINCGSKSCLNCLNCYEFNSKIIINEVLK